MQEDDALQAERKRQRSSPLGDFVAARDALAAEGLDSGVESVGPPATEPPPRRDGSLRALLLLLGGGFLAAVVGLFLGVVSYDQRFIFDKGGVWDAIAVVSYVLLLVGLVVALGAIVGIIGVLVARGVRGLLR